MQANIWKLYLIKMSKWFMVFMPVVVLFFESNGLNLRQVMTINAIYSMSVAAFEIPSGYFSDRIGRKLSIILGTLCITGQFIFYSGSYQFWSFLPGAVIGGLGASFISGTDSALLYDSLYALDRKDDYLRWEGRTYAVGTFSEAVAAIIGGWLAYRFSLRLPIIVQVGISMIGVITALTLVEPPVHKNQQRSNWEQIKHILRYIFTQSKRLLLFIGLNTVFGLAALLLAWFAQPYFDYNNLEENKIGYLWAALNMTVAVFSMQAAWFNKTFSAKYLVGMVLGGFSLGFVGLSFCGNAYVFWGLGIMFIMYALRGIATPTFLNLINQLAPSDMRATVLSMRGFFVRIAYALAAPFLGWLADVFTILEALAAMGVMVGSASLVALLFYAWIRKA